MWSPCLDCTSLLMRRWLPPLLLLPLLLLPLLLALRLAAPEASAEQQGQEDPGGSRHCGGPEQTHFSGAAVAAARPPGQSL